ncbi:MAG: ImmA/IrrE family metallo-endopeptidase [Deltaproteobacteria bacterium]|nr:ImmA/IrrE family metallo-endopeptidase [Deltaproteobacteria bacterium]
MKTQVIKNAEQHAASLAEIDRLIMLNPKAGSDEADQLAVFAVLVEEYERNRFPIEQPTPIEAIRFRMEEANLTPRDLEPYIGSKSKVSEVLSGKVPLSLRMIRALHEGLGIPAEVLLQSQPVHNQQEEDINWSRFPVAEMAKRGWIEATKKQIKEASAALAKQFLTNLPGVPAAAYFRQTKKRLYGASIDEYALAAWISRVNILGNASSDVKTFNPNTMTDTFMQDLARLSRHPQGPIEARRVLANAGIALVIEPHLPRTKLDGMVMLSHTGRPIIGLTLRYDRLDSFWFTLLHEVAHLKLHITKPDDAFIDDLDFDASDDKCEREADRAAGEALIPRAVWKRSAAFRERTPESVIAFAAKLNIHPAIVAGRLRKETRNYRLFNQLVGNKQVRVLFAGGKNHE